MEIEHSATVKGQFAYYLDEWEKKVIARSLEGQVKKRTRRIEAIYRYPDNDGSAKYQMKIDALDRERQAIEKIISEFGK